MNKLYLGDSVYVEFTDDGLIKLTTENGYLDPRNVIYLEPEVYNNLKLWVDKLPESL